MRNAIFKYISLALILILASCATDYKRWPSGGIVDRISPTITFYTPQEGSLNQDKDITAEIEFSEFIDHNSTRNAITISPYSIQQKSKIIWYEKSVKIEFSGLSDDQTVLVVVNTSLSDLRKNNIKTNFILNFSTGEKIDEKELSGKINGAIIGKNIKQINYSKLKINLYRKDEFLSYEINDMNPEYSVGVSDDMSYKFTNISADNYVPLVYHDKNNNSKLELKDEYLALAQLVDLNGNDEQNLDFVLAKSDTISPFISEITQIEKDILKIELSEGVVLKENIISTIAQDTTNVNFEEFYNPNVKEIIYIRSNDIDFTKEMIINSSAFTDLYGNIINEKMRSKTVFIADTLKEEKIKITPNFKTNIYLDQDIRFNFNRVEPDSIFIELISNVDSSIIKLNDVVINRPFISEIDLAKKGIAEGEYSIIVKHGAKEIFSRNITIDKEFGFGSVSGKVENATIGANLIFQNCENRDLSSIKYGVVSDYKLQLRPGKYICAGYLDKDKNGLFGIDIDNLSTEKAVFLKDTVLIRKNWESGDINFDF